jgi:MFS family permease
MASASFAPLRHRGFVLALSSSFVSSTGTWMQSVALGVYIADKTHNDIWLGLITAAAWVPAIIGSPVGGVFSERLNRQRWIQSCNFIMAITASLLAIAEVTHHLSLPIACYLAVVEGLCGSASWAAWQSLLRDLVEKEEVLAAVSLSSAQFNLGRIIGPALAGVALGVGSISWCFALNAASFIFVVVIFSFVKSPPRARVLAKVRIWAETVVGAKVAWSVRGCRNPIIAVGVVALIASPFITLVPAMAVHTLHDGSVGTAWLVGAQGVGAVIGAVTLPAVAKRSSRVSVLRGSLYVLALAEALYALAPTLALSVCALVLLGGAYVGTLTGLNTSVQLHAPTSERSRILALYTLSLSMLYPLGATIQSAFATTWGVRPVTFVAACILGLIVAGVNIFKPQFWREMGSPTTERIELLAD